MPNQKIVYTVLLSALRLIAPMAAVAPALAPSSLSSEAELCFGQVPTIVGTSGSSLIGTDGPDVVVSNGAAVDTGRGNDLLCITEAPENSKHSTGAGNDRVLNASEPATSDAQIAINLGAGMDEFTGGAWNEYILAAHGHDGHGDRDTISTGDGADSVYTGGESARGDNIDLGQGEDSLIVKRSPPPGALKVVGEGEDNYLGLDRPGNKVGFLVLNNVKGELSRDRRLIARLDGFTSFGLIVQPQFDFVGSDAAEQLTLSPKQGSLGFSEWSIDLAMGGGDDTLTTSMFEAHDSRYDGGDGSDTIGLGTGGFGEESIVFDMAAGTVQVSAHGHTTTRTAMGFEDVVMPSYVRATTILGTDGPNRLTIAYGGEPPKPTVLDGRAGDDVLRGGFGDDTLVGGPGHDLANGRGGSDKCLAEERIDCES